VEGVPADFVDENAITAGGRLRMIQTNRVRSRECPRAGLEAVQNPEMAPLALVPSQWSFGGFVSKFTRFCGCSLLVETLRLCTSDCGLFAEARKYELDVMLQEKKKKEKEKENKSNS
jgi:hypothetical protein